VTRFKETGILDTRSWNWFAVESEAEMAVDMSLHLSMADGLVEGNTFDHYLAIDLFHRAQFHGFLRRLGSILTRRSTRMDRLSDEPLRFQSSHSAGLQEVAIDRIRGSEGREHDFDNRFYPISDRTRQRWLSVAKAYYQGIGLPPVVLIQVGETYFVRDGHHRVSVAQAFGQGTVVAEVTVWKLE
jgi:hypothetical protein